MGEISGITLYKALFYKEKNVAQGIFLTCSTLQSLKVSKIITKHSFSESQVYCFLGFFFFFPHFPGLDVRNFFFFFIMFESNGLSLTDHIYSFFFFFFEYPFLHTWSFYIFFFYSKKWKAILNLKAIPKQAIGQV